MIKDPSFVGVDLGLNQILKKFETSGLSHLLVSDENNQLMGIISKADLVSRLDFLTKNSSGKTYSALSRQGISAADIMTEKPICIKPDDDVAYAVELLLQKKFHALPVVKDNRPIGIVTFYDLLKGYYQEFG